MSEIPSSEPSNKRPMILLIIAVVILLILIGVWQWGGFGSSIFNKTKRPKPLTEAEKVQITAENEAIMLQFASTATFTAQTAAALKKEEQKNTETMELFSPAAPIVGTKEGKENYNIMKLFQ